MGSGRARPKTIQANPLNWRLHDDAQRAALREVIKKVGVVDRVIVNRTTGRLVDGHLRVELALEEGEPWVDVDYVELNEDEERLVLATFDSITGMATTDRGRFLEVLAGIREKTSAELEDALRTIRETTVGLDVQPPEFPEKEGGLGDGVEHLECPKCGHRWPK